MVRITTHAGIADALICLVLLSGATALLRGTPNARTIALGAMTFVILGFLVGLNFTIRGGDAIGITYHLTVAAAPADAAARAQAS